MIQILESNRKPSFGQSILQGLKAAEPGIKDYLANQEQRKAMQMENAALEKQGYGVSGISSKEGRQSVFEKANLENIEKQKHLNKMAQIEQEQALKQKGVAEKQDQENLEKLAPFESGLETISKMRKIKKRNNLGIFSAAKGIIDPKTRQDRAEYAQLGKSLISMASTIPIRNKAEFETLAHDLYNPNNTDEKNEGILNAMEGIIKSNMEPYLRKSQGIGNQPTNIERTNQQLPPLKSYME